MAITSDYETIRFHKAVYLSDWRRGTVQMAVGEEDPDKALCTVLHMYGEAQMSIIAAIGQRLAEHLEVCMYVYNDTWTIPLMCSRVWRNGKPLFLTGAMCPGKESVLVDRHGRTQTLYSGILQYAFVGMYGAGGVHSRNTYWQGKRCRCGRAARGTLAWLGTQLSHKFHLRLRACACSSLLSTFCFLCTFPHPPPITHSLINSGSHLHLLLSARPSLPQI